jgi:hypothetical protein
MDAQTKEKLGTSADQNDFHFPLSFFENDWQSNRLYRYNLLVQHEWSSNSITDQSSLHLSTEGVDSLSGIMAGRYPYSQTGNTSNGPPLPLPPPPPPPPALGNDARAPQAFSYGYSYGYGYPSVPQSLRLAPGQAPPQANPAEPQVSQTSPGEPSTPEKSEQKESSWFCDACNLALDSQQAFKGHRRSHVKCSDCSFEAAPKIVKAHYQGSHGKFSGAGFKTITVTVPGCRVQRFRICIGNRPEDIQRWIEDRKKRFPRQNSVKNEAKDEAKDAKSAVPKKETTGMTSLLAGYGSSGSENDDVAVEENTVLDNGGSPQKEEKLQNDKPANGPPQSVQDRRIDRPCRYFLRNGSCLNGESCRFSHEAPAKRFATDNGEKKRKRGGPTTSDTLLRKLLTGDMERESALTMQLLEFIVKKDFFKASSG